VDKRLNILFTATFTSPFIRTDLSILQRHHHVTSVITSGFPALFRYLISLTQSDVTFSWFASVYSSILVMFAQMLRKHSVLILGGVDVAKLPQFNYGIWNSRWRSWIVRYGIRNADVVLAVDESIKRDAMQLAGYDAKNITVLPTGHDGGRWIPGNKERRSTILTVAACDSETRFRVKGIDFLYAIARALPEQQFILVGMSEQMQTLYPPPLNLTVYPYLSEEELLLHYQTSAVYLQPSFREALGSSLCEAMLCECFPVGTDTGGIPTVIGTTGMVIPSGDIEAAVSALKQALTKYPCAPARQRILNNFSLQQREAGLLTALQQFDVR
jgi:glycosyltransferase involved in cell wall biosynthesis